MKRIGVIFILAILILGLAGCSSSESSKTESEATSNFESMKQMPEFKCKDINGNEVTNEIFKDKKLTMINIWGTFCGPCIEEMPELQELYKEMEAQGVNIIGVVSDGMENEEDALNIINQQKITYTNIIPNKKFKDEFVDKTDAVPVSILINSKGERVGNVIVGAIPKNMYKKILEENLKNIK